MTVRLQNGTRGILSDEERKKEVRKLLKAELENARSQREGFFRRLQENIREYERRYEMSSETMLKKLGSGEVRETTEIAKWVISCRILARVGEVTNTGGTR